MTIADILATVTATLGTVAVYSTNGETVECRPVEGKPITDQGWTFQPPTVALTPWRNGVMWTETKTVTDNRGRDRSETSATFVWDRELLEQLLDIYAHDLRVYGWVEDDT